MIFDLAQAKYFCGGYGASTGSSNLSAQAFFDNQLIAHRQITEGMPIFTEYRDCLLREAERNILLAAVLHRRGLDMMSLGYASFLQVGYYYSSFYSARSLLGLCGVWFDNRKRTVVAVGQPGNQAITVTRNFRPSVDGGPHQLFWDSFYAEMGPWKVWAPVHHRNVLDPVSSNTRWLIENRNRINYISMDALDLMHRFAQSFDKRLFPDSLPGELKIQFRVADGLLLAACWLANECGLNTDALRVIGITRAEALRRHVFDARPSRLGRHSRRREILT